MNPFELVYHQLEFWFKTAFGFYGWEIAFITWSINIIGLVMFMWLVSHGEKPHKKTEVRNG